MVLVAVIMLLVYCWFSMMRAAVPHLYLNDPSLTTITVTSWISIEMYLSEVILDQWVGLHIFSSEE